MGTFEVDVTDPNWALSVVDRMRAWNDPDKAFMLGFAVGCMTPPADAAKLLTELGMPNVAEAVAQITSSTKGADDGMG